LRKGNQVYIEGKIRSEEWQDKTGATVRGYRIRATSMNLIGGRNEKGNDVPERPKPAAVNLNAPAANENPFPSVMQEDDDVLPF
jgi:single-strand DNA-binding protein